MTGRIRMSKQNKHENQSKDIEGKKTKVKRERKGNKGRMRNEKERKMSERKQGLENEDK